MQYTVLARKYRPQSFEQVCAQDHVTKILISSVEKDRIAGAYLFTGPRGVGKTSLARIFAKSLNCQQGPTVHPCGECSNCKEIEKAISYDVAEIDGASNTGVDDIRELQRELMYTTTSSKYKIYIIDEVHMLSTSAFNALLKTLEEPPDRVIFMFATTEPHKILPTILSRCQRFDLKRIPFVAILENLKAICKKESIQAEEQALAVIAHKADGGMRDALSLLDQMISYSAEKIEHKDVLFMFGIVSWQVYLQILEKISCKDTAGVLAEFAEVVDAGNGVVEFMTGFLDFLSSLLTLYYTNQSQEMPVDVAQKAQKLAKDLGERTLILLIDMLAEAVGKIKQSANQTFVAELALIRLSKVEQMKSVDKIISYLKNNSANYSGQAAARVQNATTQKVEIAKPKQVVEPNLGNAEPKKEQNKSERQEPKVEVPQESKAPAQKAQQVSPKPRAELTQEEFDKALPEICDLLKQNNFGVFLINFFSEYPKKVLAGNVLQIEFPNKFEQSSFGRDASTFAKLLSNFFGVNLQIAVRVNSAKKVPQKNKVSKNQVQPSEDSLAEIGKENAKVAEFIKKIDGEIVR